MNQLLRLLSAPFRWVWRLVARPAPSQVTKTEKATPPRSELEELGDQMQSMRDSLRTMGGAFAAAAGVVVGGLGYARVHDAFPFPAGQVALGPFPFHPLGPVGPFGPIGPFVVANAVLGPLVLAFGAFLALGGAAYFSARFFAAQRRIPMQSKTTEIRGLTAAEVSIRDRMFYEDAQAEDASTLEALELRAGRLNRIARRQPEGPARAALEKETARLGGVIRLTFRRAAGAILEHRAQDVYSGWPTKVAIGAFIFGVVVLFGTADWAKGQRDLIDLRAKCAEAQLKGAPDACKPVRTQAHQNPSQLRTTPAEATARRQGKMRINLLVSCLRRVLPVARKKPPKKSPGSVDKEVIVAAIGLCSGTNSG